MRSNRNAPRWACRSGNPERYKDADGTQETERGECGRLITQGSQWLSSVGVQSGKLLIWRRVVVLRRLEVNEEADRREPSVVGSGRFNYYLWLDGPFAANSKLTIFELFHRRTCYGRTEFPLCIRTAPKIPWAPGDLFSIYNLKVVNGCKPQLFAPKTPNFLSHFDFWNSYYFSKSNF